ncbi:MAG TPA: hydrolase [Vicinamibacteria bacterium]|nr:hydrolase [Vicinamibacteria bacterium]
MTETRRAATLLRPERTVLVVVDLQEKLLPVIGGRERVVKNSLLLMRLAGILGIPVVLTTQYRKGLGEIVPEVRAAAPDAEPLDKVSFGCFGDEAFLGRLRGLPGRDQLLVTGIESHICVAQTVLGALEQGYQVHLVGDAVGSRAEENCRTGLARMERAGATLSSAEMATYELLGRSDSDAFKKMLPHLKG